MLSDRKLQVTPSPVRVTILTTLIGQKSLPRNPNFRLGFLHQIRTKELTLAQIIPTDRGSTPTPVQSPLLLPFRHQKWVQFPCWSLVFSLNLLTHQASTHESCHVHLHSRPPESFQPLYILVPPKIARQGWAGTKLCGDPQWP